MAERRKWTDTQKAEYVAEAEQPGGSFSEVSRRYGVPLNLLFCWRKALRGGSSELQNMLLTLSDFEKEVPSLLTDLRTARKQGMAPLNAINAFSALANSLCKVIVTKADLIERLSDNLPAKETTDESPVASPDPKAERAAERLLVAIVKKQLASEPEAS